MSGHYDDSLDDIPTQQQLADDAPYDPFDIDPADVSALDIVHQGSQHAFSFDTAKSFMEYITSEENSVHPTLGDIFALAHFVVLSDDLAQEQRAKERPTEGRVFTLEAKVRARHLAHNLISWILETTRVLSLHDYVNTILLMVSGQPIPEALFDTSLADEQRLEVLSEFLDSFVGDRIFFPSEIATPLGQFLAEKVPPFLDTVKSMTFLERADHVEEFFNFLANMILLETVEASKTEQIMIPSPDQSAPGIEESIGYQKLQQLLNDHYTMDMQDVREMFDGDDVPDRPSIQSCILIMKAFYENYAMFRCFVEDEYGNQLFAMTAAQYFDSELQAEFGKEGVPEVSLTMELDPELQGDLSLFGLELKDIFLEDGQFNEKLEAAKQRVIRDYDDEKKRKDSKDKLTTKRKALKGILSDGKMRELMDKVEKAEKTIREREGRVQTLRHARNTIANAMSNGASLLSAQVISAYEALGLLQGEESVTDISVERIDEQFNGALAEASGASFSEETEAFNSQLADLHGEISQLAKSMGFEGVFSAEALKSEIKVADRELDLIDRLDGLADGGIIQDAVFTRVDRVKSQRKRARLRRAKGVIPSTPTAQQQKGADQPALG